jgi:hypothetical protein
MQNLKINNVSLRRDLEMILKSNFGISKGSISGNSIEVDENISTSTYTYYGNVKQRDEDFNTLVNLKNK